MRILLITLFSFCLLGCSYNFSEDNYIELAQPTADGIEITLSPFTEGETINVDKTINYTILAQPDQYGIETEIFMDAKKIASSQRNNSGEFTLRPSTYDDGIHKIRVVHTLSSGTGSLAEQLQSEAMVLTKEFEFVVKREPSLPPSINDARIENGSITVEWEYDATVEYSEAYLSLKYPGREKRILLTEEMLEQESYIDTYTVLFPYNSINDTDKNSSEITYSIVFISEFEELYGTGKTLESDTSWVQYTLYYLGDDKFKITWPQHPLYSNFDSYNASMQQRNNSSDYYRIEISGSSSGGEVIINSEDLRLGADYLISMAPATIDPFIPYYRSTPTLDEESIGQIQSMDNVLGKSIFFNSSTSQYYMLASTEGNTYVYRYSQNLEYIDRTMVLAGFNLSSSFVMEMDFENNIFYIDVRYLTSSGITTSTIKLDSNLNLLNRYEFQSPTGNESYQVRGNISKYWHFRDKLLTVTNIDTGAILYTGNAENMGYLANDGGYIHIRTGGRDVIYKIQDDSLLEIGELENLGSNLAINQNKLYYATRDYNLVTLDLNTNQSQSFGYLSGYNSHYLTFDVFSNKVLLTTNNGNAFIVDLNNQTTSKYIYVDTRYNPNKDYYLSLTNGRLIHTKGIYIDLQ